MTDSDMPPATGWHPRLQKYTRRLSWLYTLAVVGVLALLYFASDEWWPATLIMFGPRWIWGAPLVILLPLALGLRSHALWPLLLSLGLVVVPIMGLCLPWRTLTQRGEGGKPCRVLTFNTHRYRDRFSPAELRRVIEETRPDIVALQDWEGDVEIQRELFDGKDWHVHSEDQFCLASRFPILETELLDSPPECKGKMIRYDLDMPAGRTHFFSVHLSSPRDGLLQVRNGGWKGVEGIQTNSNARRNQSAYGSRWVSSFGGSLLMAGDFNTPTDSTVYREYWGPFTNAFSVAGMGWGPTHFTEKTAIRIDHILAGPGWRCRHCWVGPDISSEHRPVIADLEWKE